MKYILIVLWIGNSSSYSGKAALAVEFNTMESCQAAAAEIKRQEGGSSASQVRTLLCAQKGAPQAK